MKLPNIKDVSSAEQARDLAIDWQDWQSGQALSINELVRYHAFFMVLAKKFPELRAEFKENAII